MRLYKRHINKTEYYNIKSSIIQGSWYIHCMEYGDDADDDWCDDDDRGYYIYYEVFPQDEYKEISERGYSVVDMYSIYPTEIKRIKIIDDILS